MVRRIGILSFTLIMALLAMIGYWLLFTVFMSHDDEGYVLISLSNYSLHGGLYSQVYSQYGPFFYLVHDWGHRVFGYQFTNTNARLITLLCWLTASGACAHLVWRETRAAALTAFTLGLTFLYLWLMVGEPIHPGGPIAAMVAIGAWLGAWLIDRRAMTAFASTAGTIGAALLLTKINVGIFFLTSAAIWFVVNHRDQRTTRVASVTMAGLLVLLPLGLMHAELHDGWAKIFARLSVVASLTVLAGAWRERESLTTWKHAGWGAACVFLTAALVIGAVGLRGTSFREMLDGIFFSPLRHPGVYHYPPDWKPWAVWAAGVSLLLAVLFWRRSFAWLTGVIIALRILLVVELGLAALELLPFSSHSSVMSYAVPFSWIFVVRLASNERSPRVGGAVWVGLLLVLQYLHAYPVAGSQVAWASFLIIPLIALGLHDTQARLKQTGHFFWAPAIGIACFVSAVSQLGWIGQIGWHRYSKSRPLRLPGAEDLRLPEDFASTIRLLSLNATAHGDMLFSLPGMFSFNGWTQLPTPTLQNTTHWFSLLNREQQEATITALAQSKRPVVLVHHGLIDFLTASEFVVESPLHDYLREHFVRAFKLGQYEFWIRQGRRIAPLSSAEFLQLETEQPGLPQHRLDLVLALPEGRRIASIELATLEESPRILARWDKGTGPLLAAGIDLQGNVIAPESPSTWEVDLPRLARFTLPLQKLPEQSLDSIRRTAAVYLRDASGELVAEARFIERP